VALGSALITIAAGVAMLVLLLPLIGLILAVGFAVVISLIAAVYVWLLLARRRLRRNMRQWRQPPDPQGVPPRPKKKINVKVHTPP